ncbi:MAG: flavin-containing monooxygenase [Nocardioides sp.]
MSTNTREPLPQTEKVDVLIIGAGLSGIGAAAQLRKDHPDLTIKILDRRERIGGTWDLFRYPGIRSDSDMFTFSYKDHPWPSTRTLADGDTIVDYIRTVADQTGVAEFIDYERLVTRADFSSLDNTWTVTATTPDGLRTYAATWLWSCAGYYSYDSGYQPDFPGLADYEGTFVHPQFWPEDLDYDAKKVVVIGSGATAVTLVPSMAERVEHITMLQRTPTYILSRPGNDPMAVFFDWLPSLGPLKKLRDRASYESVRWTNVLLTVGSYQLAQRRPKLVKKIIRDQTIKWLTAREGNAAGEGFTPEEAAEIVDTHFNPPYDPWDQRLCFVPDGDLFRWMRKGKASVVTDRIKTFTAKGIETESGKTLEADIIISATGLSVQLFGGVEVYVDGEHIAKPQTMTYRGIMLTGIPNFFYTFGYTNASWTLKADLVAGFVSRMIGHMRKTGHAKVVVPRDDSVSGRPMLDLSSGYIQRILDTLPKQGDQAPWAVRQNYFTDLKVIGRGKIDDGVAVFS